MDGCRCNVVVSGRQAGSPRGLLYICIDRFSVCQVKSAFVEYVYLIGSVVGMKCAAGRQAGRQAVIYIQMLYCTSIVWIAPFFPTLLSRTPKPDAK